MKSVILTENQLSKLVKKIQIIKLNESNYQGIENYMFFSNLEQMCRQGKRLLEMNHNKIDSILQDGHDWAADHIAEAKNNLDQVFDFLMNETDQQSTMQESMKDDFSVEPWVDKQPREYELSTLFGKYQPQITNDLLRYMRKNPQSIVEMLYLLYGENLFDRLNKAKDKFEKKREKFQNK